jgi:hypothetical protein
LIAEPTVTEEVERRKREAIAKAKSLGHLIMEWKWDGYGVWQAWCEHRNCYTFVWVSPDEPGREPYGGSATGQECWLSRYKRDAL